jgi:threonyl-tRNA synthetase
MSNISIKLPDNSVHEFSSGVTPLEIARKLQFPNIDQMIAARIDSELVDLNHPIKNNGNLTLLSGDSVEGHDVLLHSTAHLMAHAVKILYPEAKVTIGPALENRFYYDFDIEGTFSEDDLEKIEKQMRLLANKDIPINRQELTKDEAIAYFTKINEPYKVEIIKEIEEGELISAYQQDSFTDLCRGPHVSSTGKLRYFKLLDTSGAYWRGDERNKMLQRI